MYTLFKVSFTNRKISFRHISLSLCKSFPIFSLIKNALSNHQNWEVAWKDPEPKKEYDVVIIGGGGHGLATAYYLAKEHKITKLPF
ncbi:MAG: hypothetical protein CM1200mP5_4970 [Candidatus Pelagibacterales bacterium]|nr:MAG: hypothetical protein CM1200mP5_4970 [Pelagibacterales bacterium]